MSIKTVNPNTNTLAVGAGILNAGSIAFTNGGTIQRHILTISTGTVTVTGNITQVGSTGSATITLTGTSVATQAFSILAKATCLISGVASTTKSITIENVHTLSSSSTITKDIAGPTAVYTVSGTTFADGATTTTNWTLGGTATLTLASVTLNGGKTQATATFTGTPTSGQTIEMTALAASLVAGVASTKKTLTATT